MNFLDKLFNKTKVDKGDKSYSSELEKLLGENHIPYDIEDLDGNTRIFYIDPFDKTIYEFDYIDEKLFYNGREISEKDALRLMDIKWKSDELIIKYMEDERYCDIFDIVDFFKDITSDNGLLDRMVPLKDMRGIKLFYNIGNMPSEKDYIAGIEMNVSKGGNATFQIIPSGMQTDANGAVLDILKKIYNEAPLFFTSGTYKVKDDTRFTDIVKTYLINLAIVNRLNEIDGVEAQITDVGKNNIIFVMFKNGSAIEYISPTRQNPRGSLLIIDLDEENLTEDNDSFSLVSKVLKLPSMIKDKPDENKMPKRDFTNKKGNRRTI